MKTSKDTPPLAPKLTGWQIFKSALAAIVGIQKEKNRQRDFSQSRVIPFLLCGVMVICGIVILMISAISLLMKFYEG